jgi:hypothetical protein
MSYKSFNFKKNKTLNKPFKEKPSSYSNFKKAKIKTKAASFKN